jgi:hypothetical protein
VPSFPTGPTPRSSLSLPCSDCPFPGPLYRLNVPGLPLWPLAESVSGSFGLRLPPSPPGFPERGRSSPATRSLHLYPATSANSLASAPLRDLSIPPDRRSTQFSAEKPTCAERPLSLHSPLAELFITSASGSPFQARCVPRGSLFHEPLGTSSIMHQGGGPVKRKSGEGGSFPKLFSACVSIRYAPRSQDFLWIKQAQRFMFAARRYWLVSFRIIPVSVAAHSCPAPPVARTTWVATAL